MRDGCAVVVYPKLKDCSHPSGVSLRVGSPSAMAPKAKKAFGPKILCSSRVPLDDLSVEEDSGWRDGDEERVDELVEMIKDVASLGKV